MEVTHIILFSSRKRFTASYVNKALEQKFTFTEFKLEGNLRSAPKISELARDFQDKVVSDIAANIPVTTALSFSAPEPHIQVIDDPSMERKTLLDASAKIMDKILKDGDVDEILICSFSHTHLSRKIEENILSDQIKMAFKSSNDVLGCQFQAVLIILDLSTCIPIDQDITDAITRATTMVQVLINKTMEPMKIAGVPCIQSVSCPKP